MHALPALDPELPVFDAELLNRYDRPGPRPTLGLRPIDRRTP